LARKSKTARKSCRLKRNGSPVFIAFFYIVAMRKAITSDFSSATDYLMSPKKTTSCVTRCIYCFCFARTSASAYRVFFYPRPQYWFENLLNSNALNMWWKENFLVTRETFHFICTAVAPVIQRKDTILRAAIPVETRTAIGLWRLATGDSYRSCGLMFGIAKSTAIGVCKDFIHALCQLKDQLYIKFPSCLLQ